MVEPKAKRPAVDWEAVEREYRAGIRSLRDIGEQFGVSNPAIVKRAKRDGWERDLSAKIHAKAESLVSKQLVSTLVSTQTNVSERQIVEANANLLADTVLNQRTDIKRAMNIVVGLWNQIEAEGDYTEEFRRVGELMRNENDFGEDKLNDMYFAAIGMPQRVKSVKLLADALKVLIELQRKVLRIDEKSEPTDTASTLTDAQRASRIATLLSKAGS